MSTPPPLIGWYTPASATALRVPIYIPLPAQRTASEGQKPELMVLVPR
jgi:hypothetical protein